MLFESIFNVCEGLINGGVAVTQWATTPVDLGFTQVTPIMILSFGFLFTYLIVAIAKWII